jgi:predicted TIM-barrel fold metal-dependent hydrolase
MYEIFSVDDHVVEHPAVWTSRLPKKYVEVGPHVVDDGSQEFWEFEDQRVYTNKLAATAGLPREEWSLEQARFTDLIPGCYDPKVRAQDLLSQGVLASISFPSLPRFGGMLFVNFEDKVLADLCVKAWNDFILDEWCPAGPPGLYVPMTICQVWDPALAADEIRRCVDKGSKALCFTENPVPDGLPSFHSDHWNPIWQACEETGIPVCMHVGSSGFYPGDAASPIGALVSGGNVGGILGIVNMLNSPVCLNFPEIKMVWSEAGIGWIPAVLERADRAVERHQWEKPMTMKPSEIFQRNMWACMIEEPVGLSLYKLIGADKIFAETDYPHTDTTFPDVQEAFAAVVDGIPDDVVKAVAYQNAERVFDWKMADASLATLSTWVRPTDVAPPPGIIKREAIAGRCQHLVLASNDLRPCNEPLDADGSCSAGHTSKVAV